jgi:hypothetical protein
MSGINPETLEAIYRSTRRELRNSVTRIVLRPDIADASELREAP